MEDITTAITAEEMSNVASSEVAYSIPVTSDTEEESQTDIPSSQYKDNTNINTGAMNAIIFNESETYDNSPEIVEGVDSTAFSNVTE